MNLVIVESPAKAKTIEGFLGKDFLVKSSYGHIRDLAKNGTSIDIENGFLPQYEVMPDKKAIIKELQKLTKDAEMVWLATDEDREGEAISWHLAEVLELDPKKIKRIVFHEITKPAILKAISNPRTINGDLVNAQQARRVLDRLVGFELSPVLWKKVKPSLSAGRVQSVAVRLIVEREREVQGFTPESTFRVVGNFNLEQTNGTLKADLSKRFKSEEEADTFLKSCVGATYTINGLETKPGKKSPSAPFTTSTLQQEASRKLGFSVAQTMTIAQRLYEAGKITYMRTDSVNLSTTAINAAKDEIIKSYGEEYANPRKFSTKSKNAQEAHEAIRPTYMDQHTIEEGDRAEQRLYDLIWKRTIASQMAEAKLEKTTAKIGISSAEQTFEASGEVLKFDGFLKVYMESTDEDDDQEQKGILPPLTVGEELKIKDILATERFSHHAPRYTEASLVKKMEELGIGRPSTYAPTISTIQKRGYVEKESKEGKERKYTQLILEGADIVKKEQTEITGAEKNKLFPTDIGMVVNDFLVDHFNSILNYNFTATVEKEFDEIAQGQKKWNDMIDQFYGPFHANIEETLENSERATGERELGIDPASGKRIIARIGRFGPMIQIGEVEDEEKPRFASLKKEQSISSVTLEEALDLFKLPRDLGEYEEEMIVVGQGKFGPYVRHKGKFVSIDVAGGDNPLELSKDRAIELILAKRKADSERIIKKFEEDDELEVLNGRYGPYISLGRKNFKIPKDKDPASLTYEEAVAITKAPKPTRSRKKAKS